MAMVIVMVVERRRRGKGERGRHSGLHTVMPAEMDRQAGTRGGGERMEGKKEGVR